MLSRFNLSEKERKVFRLIYCLGSTTRQQLLKKTRYTAPTVYRVIEELMRKGLVAIAGVEEEPGKGRPTERISVRGDAGWILSVHITRLGFNVALVDLSGALGPVMGHAFAGPTPPSQVVEMVWQDAQALSGQAGLEPGGLLGVGLAAVGPIDYQQGLMKGPIHFSGGQWVDVPMAELLRQRLGKPLVYNCNASACLLGHYLPAYYDTYANMAYITLGSGIGSGLVLSHVLPSRRHVILDGLAHMTIELGGRRCTCGAYGCVEAYVSRYAIVGDCQRSLKMGVPSLLSPYADSLTIQQVGQALLAGDQLAQSVVREAAAIFACCLANYLRVVDLEAVIMGGSLIESLPSFFDDIRGAMEARLRPCVPLIRGERETENVLRGIAAQLVMETLVR